MTYREMMDLYKEGKLEGIKKEKIERDIEQHEIISDYLYENESMPSVSEILLDEKMENKEDKAETIAEKRAAAEKKAEQDAKVFIKRAKKAVRRMMIRMGVVVGIVVLAIVLTVMFVIPKIANRFYYDPMNANGSTFTKDMAVYSRMFAPDKSWSDLKITGNGYGEYDLTVNYEHPDGISDHMAFETVSGKLSKGKLDMNGSDVFERKNSYPFRPEYAGVYRRYNYQASSCSMNEYDPDISDKCIKELAGLDDDTVYDAYITFARPLSLNEVIDFRVKMIDNEIYFETDWWAVCRKDESLNGVMEEEYEASVTMGFAGCSKNSVPSYFYRNSVGTPADDMWYTGVDESEKNEGIKEMTEKYIEAVGYMAGRTDFIKMVNKDNSYKYYSDYNEDSIKNYLNGFADDLEKDGVYVYGVRLGLIKGDYVKNLSKLSDEGIAYIYTEVPRS